MSLVEIGLRNFTEKAREGFLDIYEPLWESIRLDPITLLEIGVYNGNSMRTWCEYFPNARIVGIDKNVNPRDREHTGAVHYGDQVDTEFLDQILTLYKEFDIIIDDGSHYWEDQQISFAYLWPYVKPGGMYIIEDLQTSKDTFWAKGGITTVDYLKKWVWDIVLDNAQDIKQINFYYRLAILFKR